MKPRPTGLSVASVGTPWRRRGSSRRGSSSAVLADTRGGTLIAALLLAPVLLLPNPQDLVIAQQERLRRRRNGRPSGSTGLRRISNRKDSMPTTRAPNWPKNCASLRCAFESSPTSSMPT
jgi:hypothetical protein